MGSRESGRRRRREGGDEGRGARVHGEGEVVRSRGGGGGCGGDEGKEARETAQSASHTAEGGARGSTRSGGGLKPAPLRPGLLDNWEIGPPLLLRPGFHRPTMNKFSGLMVRNKLGGWRERKSLPLLVLMASPRGRPKIYK